MFGQVKLKLVLRTFRNLQEYSKEAWPESGINPLSSNPTKWSNTLKQFAGNLPTNCLSVFNHFVKLTLKGPKRGSLLPKFYCDCNLNSTESYEPPLKFMETWWILNYFIFKMETYLFWIFWGSWFSWGLPGFYGNL